MLNRIAALMQRLPAGTDAALIQSDVNRRYFTGMLSSAGTVLCSGTARILSLISGILKRRAPL